MDWKHTCLRPRPSPHGWHFLAAIMTQTWSHSQDSQSTGHSTPSLVQNKSLHSQVCKSLIRQDQCKCEVLRMSNRRCFEPAYLLVSAAVGFWPVHSWVWPVYHHRVQKCWYRLLFQTCIQRVTFHTSHVGNSSQEFLTSISLQTSMGWRATEQNALLVAQSLQNGFSLHCNRKTSWKWPPGNASQNTPTKSEPAQ